MAADWSEWIKRDVRIRGDVSFRSEHLVGFAPSVEIQISGMARSVR